MSGHTKGPWAINRAKQPDNVGGTDYAIVVVIDGRPRVLAEAFQRVGEKAGGGYIDAPAEANARLIAAAPTLVAALEGLMEAVPTQTNDRDWWPDELTRAMAAARKALDEAGIEP